MKLQNLCPSLKNTKVANKTEREKNEMMSADLILFQLRIVKTNELKDDTVIVLKLLCNKRTWNFKIKNTLSQTASKASKMLKKAKKKLNPHDSSEQLIPTVELRFKAKFFLDTNFWKWIHAK